MLYTKIDLDEYTSTAVGIVRDKQTKGVMGFIAVKVMENAPPFAAIPAPWEKLDAPTLLGLALTAFEVLQKRRPSKDGVLQWDEKRNLKPMVAHLDSLAPSFDAEEAGLYRELREKMEAVAPEIMIARDEMDRDRDPRSQNPFVHA